MSEIWTGLDNWLDYTLATAARVTPNRPNLELEEFHVPKRVTPAESTIELMHDHRFKGLQILVEKDPIINEDALVLQSVTHVLFKGRKKVRHWPCIANELYDDRKHGHACASILVAYLLAMGPLPVMVGAFDPIPLFGGLRYVAYYVPASVGKTRYPILKFVYASGISSKHEKYQADAEPLVHLRDGDAKPVPYIRK